MAGTGESVEEDDGEGGHLVATAARIGSYQAEIELVDDAAGLIFLLWAIQQPTLSKPNFFVSHSSMELRLDACGHQIYISQTPSSMVNI